MLFEIRRHAPPPLLLAWVEPFDSVSLTWVADLVDMMPALPVLVGAPPSDFDQLAILASTGTKDAVLLYEGLIVLADTPGSPGGSNIALTGGDHAPELAAQGLSEAVQLHQRAVTEIRTGQPSAEGPYDSAAEAFLALLLNSHPLTAGLFQPQGLPGFAMQGGRAARVDFLAPEVRVAIEVDGPHHLEAVQYRRDRHKDLELQARGYVVVRFLAEDIAGDFEQIRATINRIVSARARETRQFAV